jgi:hypothetical protein
LNETVENTRSLSECVDSFGATLYPTQDFVKLRAEAQRVCAAGRSLVDMAQSLSSTSTTTAPAAPDAHEKLISLGIQKLEEALKEINEATL